MFHGTLRATADQENIRQEENARIPAEPDSATPARRYGVRILPIPLATAVTNSLASGVTAEGKRLPILPSSDGMVKPSSGDVSDECFRQGCAAGSEQRQE